MRIDILRVPYDSGHQYLRAGRGPDRFIERGLERMLADRGHQSKTQVLASERPLDTEIGTAFALNQRLSGRIKADGGDWFPLVLSGNCNSCLGTLAGIGAKDTGIIWFDAHGDFNTPETTVTGFLDGMGLAMAAGRCWQAMLQKVPGYEPVTAERIVHAGACALDAAEQVMFAQAGISVIPPDAPGGFLPALRMALDKLKERTDRVYVHIDLDAVEAGPARGNELAVPGGGLDVETMLAALGMIRRTFTVAACCLASYDPEYDREEVIVKAGLSFVAALL